MIQDMGLGWSAEDIAARGAKASNEISRLYGLQDRWLAEALLRLTRDIRDRHPDKFNLLSEMSYSCNLVWHIVPEVARRLGATKFRSNENTKDEFRYCSGFDLRIAAGMSLLHSDIASLGFDVPGTTPSSEEILGHPISNGNPVVFALDRIAPAAVRRTDRKDWLARHLREISRERGHRETPHWTPDLERKPDIFLQPGPEKYSSEKYSSKQYGLI